MLIAPVQKVGPSPTAISLVCLKLIEISRRVLSTRMMGEIMTLWPLNTQITVAPAMNGRIWLNCESGILPVVGLKRILEAIDAGEVDWEDSDAMQRWVKKQGIVLS